MYAPRTLFHAARGLVLMVGSVALTWLLASYAVAKIVQHNKKLRPTLLKPYNKIIRPIAGGATRRMRFSNTSAAIPAGPM
ncbi:hypothetical protein MSAS_35610 [Mycobacterium saskatchewanense]|uniref:Uncharacterized protein n=1 Tax=Mycobacterium saskatchewanense TaxID=220927 RepID=A0AAJ3NLE5_9MYCO|nr:hypothetical protein [Mycobacterium saskatchewanense]ORW67692.1 hypothetical protein AWC23_22450 [Mycobacterium saskatchewanense]BBX64387.1 hypothetical protein MSAS_35610 [Mycobacterium saskatchewanense]